MLVDIETITQLMVSAAWISPVVIALVQVIKTAIDVPSRFVPLLSLAVGVATSAVIVSFDATGLVFGVLVGLTASGLYDFGAKTVLAR